MVGLLFDRAAPGRKHKVVKTVIDTKGPVFTEACVAVCCRRLQRYLIEFKNSLKQNFDGTTGLYMLNFSEYSNFPEAISDLTSESVLQGNIWNLDPEEVRQWLGLNRTALRTLYPSVARSIVVGPINAEELINRDGHVTSREMTNVGSAITAQVNALRSGALNQIWDKVSSVATLVVFQGQWHMLTATKGHFEALIMFCLDRESPLGAQDERYLDVRECLGKLA